MFADVTPPRELRVKLDGAMLTSAAIDQQLRTIDFQMETRVELGDEDLKELSREICGVYGFSDVRIKAICCAPVSVSKSEDNYAPQGSGEKKKNGAVKDVLFGDKKISGKTIPIKDLSLKTGKATVMGKVFAFDCHETRRPGMWRMSFDMTDYTGSVTIQKNLTTAEATKVSGKIKVGMWVAVQGKMEPTWDGKDIQMAPFLINSVAHKGREDTAPVKRVELHLHTRMSNMDALTDTTQAVKQAISWEHPAIAITDHGVAQSFPEAWHAAGDQIKILYGIEGYFLNNVDDRVAVHGTRDCQLDDEFVCFDIETTGLKVMQEEITEIGAVVLKNGEITETFQTFVNPGKRLTPEIIGLTGITDEMLKDAPNLKDALTAF